MEIINWTLEAIADLNNILGYFAQDDSNYAKYFLNTVFEKVKMLEIFPDSGRICSIYNESTEMELPIQCFRIIYCCIENQINIISIIHTFP